MKIFITGIKGFLGSELQRYSIAAGHTVSGSSRTESTCKTAERERMPYQIFISSYAARHESQAEYGRMKYPLETFFLRRGHTVVRPGLVIGNGGMFGRNFNLKSMLRSPVIPLLDGGQDFIPTIAVEDFVKAMDTLVVSRNAGASIYSIVN